MVIRRIQVYPRRTVSIPRGGNAGGIFLLALMIALIIFIGYNIQPLPQAADCPTGGAISVPAGDFAEDPPIARSTP